MAAPAERGGTPTWELHHRLSRALEWADVTPDEMAEALGQHVNSVYNYASGRRVPKQSVVVAWGMRCSVPVAWLLTGEESPDPDSPAARWDVGRWGRSTWGRSSDAVPNPATECYPGLRAA